MSPKTDDAVEKTKAGGSEVEKDRNSKETSGKLEKEVEEDLSEEDKKLKDELELCVTRLQEPDEKVLN